MNLASNLVSDLVNEELEMFHCQKLPPMMAIVLTGHYPSELTRVCLLRITEYLAQSITPFNFYHHLTDTILLKNGEVKDLDENSIIIRLGYSNESLARTITLQLTTESAHMVLH